MEDVKKVLPQALREFPAAFELAMNRLITKEEAARCVPEIEESFRKSLDEFSAIYAYKETFVGERKPSDKPHMVYGEWAKLSALAARNLKIEINERDIAGTVEGIILEGSDLVFNRCYELYYLAREGKSKKFV